MTALDLNAIVERYHLALDAKPGKGPISPDGIAAITDSVADIPQLLAEFTSAIAHDRQPYPTAWAYEQTCKALAAQHVRAETAEALAERLANRLGDYSRTMQAQLDPLFKAIGVMHGLVIDWQANSGSRPLDDPTAATWNECARQLLQALTGKPTDG